MNKSRTPEYRAYQAAKDRCTNPNSNRPQYQQKGIKFLFVAFDEFYKALGPRPSKDHSLDRINNDGHYEIGNIKWSTREEQQRNKTYYLEYNRHGKGYSKLKDGRIRVRINFKGKNIHCGYCRTDSEAVLLRQEILKKLKEKYLTNAGECVSLNPELIKQIKQDIEAKNETDAK